MDSKERAMEREYRGDERRRRWPGAWTGDERRADPLVIVETDQEPDQSPIVPMPATSADRAPSP